MINTKNREWEYELTKKWYRMFLNVLGGLNLEQLQKTKTFVRKLLVTERIRTLSEVEEEMQKMICQYNREDCRDGFESFRKEALVTLTTMKAEGAKV